MGRVVTSGGSLALGELIDEHGPQLLADFQEIYGIRLPDVLFVRPPGELLALVEGLPPTSRFAAHVQGGEKWREFWGWSKDRHMFADWVDIYVKAHTEKGKKLWTYPRPGKTANGAVSFRSLIGRNI